MGCLTRIALVMLLLVSTSEAGAVMNFLSGVFQKPDDTPGGDTLLEKAGKAANKIGQALGFSEESMKRAAKKVGGFVLDRFTNALFPRMWKAMGFPRFLDKFGVTKDDARSVREGLRPIIVNLFDDFKMGQRVMDAIIDRSAADWSEFAEQFRKNRFSAETSRMLSELADDDEFATVLTRVLKKVFHSNPSLAPYSVKVLRSEVDRWQGPDGVVSGARMIEREDEISRERNQLFNLVSTSPMSDFERQRLRFNYQRWKEVWSQLVEDIRTTMPKTHSLLDSMLPAANLDAAERSNPCVSNYGKTNPFRSFNCRAPQPMAQWLPFVVLFGLVFLGCVALVVLSLASGWRDKFPLTLLILLGLAAAFRVVSFTFWGIPVGEADGRSLPSFVASDIVDRLAHLLFLGLLLVFTYVLLRANLEEKPRVVRLFTILFIVAGAAVVCYSIVMAVVVNVSKQFVYDASTPLLAVMQVALAIGLVSSWLLTLRTVRQAPHDPNYSVSMQRTLVFLITSSFLALIFLAGCVLAMLMSFHELNLWSLPYYLVMATAQLVLGLAVLAYCFAGALSALKSKRDLSHASKDGYRSLVDEDSTIDSVPLMYDV